MKGGIDVDGIRWDIIILLALLFHVVMTRQQMIAILHVTNSTRLRSFTASLAQFWCVTTVIMLTRT